MNGHAVLTNGCMYIDIVSPIFCRLDYETWERYPKYVCPTIGLNPQLCTVYGDIFYIIWNTMKIPSKRVILCTTHYMQACKVARATTTMEILETVSNVHHGLGTS